MKTAKAYVSGLIAACMSFFIVADSAAQSIKTDPILQAAIARQNWEPGGKYFSFGSVRGAVDPSSRTGQVNINQASAVTVGSFSLQSATISGEYGFVSRFSGHPYTEHSPFDNSTSSSDSVKDQRPDGSQTSYSLQWTGTSVHPADGYDGVQGGGYPAPAGARDIYNFSIKGLATATYLVSSTDLQATQKPYIQKANGDPSFWSDVRDSYASRPLWENTISPFGAIGVAAAQRSFNSDYQQYLDYRDNYEKLIFQANSSGDGLLASYYEFGEAANAANMYASLFAHASFGEATEWISPLLFLGEAVKGASNIVKGGVALANEAKLYYRNLGAVDSAVDATKYLEPVFNDASRISASLEFNVGKKISAQMPKRGWDINSLDEVVSNPYSKSPAVNKSTGGGATAYFNKDGSYVVLDDATRDVLQVSDKNDPVWVPDPTIKNPYVK